MTHDTGDHIMKLMKNEKDNRDYILHKLNMDFMGWKKKNLFLESEVPIPYKHIYIPYKNKNVLEIWCFKQDICLYKELINRSIGYRDARIVSDSKREEDIIHIVQEKDNAQNSHHVGIPYVIIETKMGEHINTHELLVYSEKVQMIKTIFPYCKFNMLFFGKPGARAYRHGLNFDDIDYLEDLSDSGIKVISKKIKAAYLEVVSDIERLS
jgi:hypothetical protein